MAPKGRELVVQRSDLINTTYNLHQATLSASNKKIWPSLEVTLDLMGNRPIRGMASLVKRYLKFISVDLAAIISKPEGQEQDEPEACLGLWCFNHIDVAKCPDLPDRFDGDALSENDHPDVIRANRLVKLAECEMSSVTIAVSA
jgi:hypothetical protein